MQQLFQFNWQAFQPWMGVKVAGGLVVMLLLTALTGETWLATALVAMFAWLCNTPGRLGHRIAGMLVFTLLSLGFTWVSGRIGLAMWPNVLLVTVLAFFSTLALLWGSRAFMVGWAFICWVIYGPFLVATTSTTNCLYAVIAGSGIVILLNIFNDLVFGREDDVQPGSAVSPAPRRDYVVVYASTVSGVMAFVTWLGWSQLETDPTLMAGGAFFVLGFDAIKTWLAGLGRAIGLALGVVVGFSLGQLLGDGLIAQLLMIAACGLSFAVFAVHPGGWMFFFTVFVAMGWPALDEALLAKTMLERFYGEMVGIAAAMAGISFLLRWQLRHPEPQEDFEDV